MSDAASDHNRILAAAARESLRPLGLTQKGRSRIWIDDHGWWTILIEFQPSAWSKGSYLNVGYQHLWRVTDHFSFARPQRLTVKGEQFVAFDPTEPDMIRKGADLLVEEARRAVEQRRLDHGDGLDAVDRIAKGHTESRYEQYDAGTALGLLGESQAAADRLSKVLAGDSSSPAWLADLKDQARAILAILDTKDALDGEVHRRVVETRSALRLPPWDGRILQ